MLRIVSKLSDSELIMEVMNGAPSYWHTVIDAQKCSTAVEFQSAIKYHEESLFHPPFTSGDSLERCLRNLEASLHQSKPKFEPENSFRDARAHLVGWSSNIGSPKSPKDDSNVGLGPNSINNLARKLGLMVYLMNSSVSVNTILVNICYLFNEL